MNQEKTLQPEALALCSGSLSPATFRSATVSMVVGENPETSFKGTLFHFALHLEINVGLSIFIADLMDAVQ